MKKYLFLSVCLLAGFYFNCKSPSQTSDKSKVLNVSDQQAINLFKFKKFSYIDQQGTGSEAFSFLMPVDLSSGQRTSSYWIYSRLVPSTSATRYGPS
jgi:hypothetical protein